MRRIGLGLLAAAVLLAATPATAKDLNGRFGVGGARSSLGQEGFAFKYWIGHLGVQAIVGMQRQMAKQSWPDPANPDSTFKGDDVTQFLEAGMRVMFNAARAKDVNLYIGGGIGIASMSFEPANSDDPAQKELSWTEVGLELLLGAEYFLSNHFSIQAEVGIPIRFPGEEGPAIGAGAGNPPLAGEGFGVRVGQVAAWGAGFNFYF